MIVVYMYIMKCVYIWYFCSIWMLQFYYQSVHCYVIQTPTIHWCPRSLGYTKPIGRSTTSWHASGLANMLCDAPAPATLSKKSHNSLEKQNKKQQKSTYLIEIHTNQQQQQQLDNKYKKMQNKYRRDWCF